MYGTVKQSQFDEEYVSLNHLNDIDEPEKIDYCTNAFNVAGCCLACTTVYGVIFYILYYVI